MINFRKKSWKVRRALQKQNRGVKPRKQNTQFQGAKIFAHLISRCENFAHPKPRCEILEPKEEDFAHPYLKVRNQFQGANFLKSNFAHHCGRCENFRTVRNPLLAHVCQFRTPQADFRTVRNSVRKFRTPLFKVRKFRTPPFKVRNLQQKGCHFRTPNSNVRNLQAKVRKFRTVKF